MSFSKILFALFVVAVIVTGCVTKNPEYTALTPAQQATNTTIPQNIPDPRINGYSNTVTTIAQGVAPVNPYAGITDWGIKLVFGIIGAIAAGVATAKNKNATINTLASGVVKAGPTAAQTVLDHAATTDNLASVATALNNSTGANQTVTGLPKG